VGAGVDAGVRSAFSIQTSGHDVLVSFYVISAPSFQTGESLSFKLVDPSGAEVIHWISIAKYGLKRDVGGPGCGDCTYLEEPVPLPPWWKVWPTSSVASDAGTSD
jgi:hypothetical protein